MNGLGRRVDAVEAIAEEVRLRPYRVLAEEHGVPVDGLMEELGRLMAERAQLRAKGKTDREILELKAARLGITPDELWRKAEALAVRFR